MKGCEEDEEEEALLGKVDVGADEGGALELARMGGEEVGVAPVSASRGTPWMLTPC